MVYQESRGQIQRSDSVNKEKGVGGEDVVLVELVELTNFVEFQEFDRMILKFMGKVK